MLKINKLPEEVANQISAGEVVERPASVVKELLENSIDADSSRILIEVDNGGKDRIRIKDDGYGIAGEELEKAFARYATSKIKGINDLYSISTLGFRGEALASIASVCEVEISSRTEDENKGHSLKLKGGKKVSKEPVGIPAGTDITVKNLFYNTPARYKYLKKTTTEFGHISSIVQREALAYPSIKFSLKHNGKLVMKTPGTGELKDVIRSIYGRELTDKIIPVNYNDRYIHLKGYLAEPDYNRSSRIYELFFVNQRAVQNNILNRGVEAGYKGLLPPGKYPVVFINIKLNRILVDVNVHPTKREIKFSRNQIVKNVLKKGVQKTLQEHADKLTPGMKMNKVDRMNINKTEKNTNKNGENINNNIHEKKDKGLKEKNKNYIIEDKNNRFIKENKIKDLDSKKRKLFDEKTDVFGEMKNASRGNAYKKDENDDDAFENFGSKVTKINNISEINHQEISIKKIYGQFAYTYIITEGTDGLYFIDQHNAHERILYDRFYKKFNRDNIASQSLLVPVQINTTLDEMEMIKNYQEQLAQMGIVIEEFGGRSFVIQEIPVIFKNRSSKEILQDLIDNLFKKGEILNNAELIKRAISYMACRGAVKAGQKLDDSEITQLIKDLLKCQNIYRCPHGRPIMSRLSEKDIDKALGR